MRHLDQLVLWARSWQSNECGSALKPHLLTLLQAVAGFKLITADKLPGFQEVQQCPQLLQAVLQGSACDEQLVLEVPTSKLLQDRQQGVSLCRYSAVQAKRYVGAGVLCTQLLRG